MSSPSSRLRGFFCNRVSLRSSLFFASSFGASRFFSPCVRKLSSFCKVGREAFLKLKFFSLHPPHSTAASFSYLILPSPENVVYGMGLPRSLALPPLSHHSPNANAINTERGGRSKKRRICHDTSLFSRSSLFSSPSRVHFRSQRQREICDTAKIRVKILILQLAL